VTQDAVRLHLFPFSLLGKAKQWFYSSNDAVSTYEKCSNAFLAKFFPLGKANALRNKISGFQQLMDETITEAWERLQDYIAAWPHHGMEEWFIIQSIYHGLIHSAQENIDATVGGCFFVLSIEEAHKLVEKMASNQNWNEERTKTRTRKVHQLEEVDMLTVKIDLLMNKLENPGHDHLKIVDARVTCEECGEIGYMGTNCVTGPRMSTSLVIPTMVFILIKASMLGGTSPVSRSTTTNRMVMGRISTEMSPPSEISSGVM
jgi:hypothetical protein